MSFDYIDFESVKKPKDDLPLTDEEIEEFKRCKNDILYWCRKYVYVQGPAGKVLFNPRPYQKRALKSFEKSDFTILKIPRQAGKSTIVAVYFLHRSVFFSDERIGVTSYKLANVKDIMDRIKFSYENLPHWMKPAVLEYNRYTIRFNNDNTITSQVTKENTFRGLSLTLVFLDELAHVKPLVADEFWTGLLPSITAGGNESTAKLIIASTPNGSGGLFAQLWFDAVAGNNGFAYVDCPYDEIPGRDEKYKEKMLKKISYNKWLQEYECHFISDKGTLVNSRTIEALKHKEPVSHVGDTDFYVDDLNGKTIAMAIDVSDGVGKDYHAIQIFDVDTIEQVAEFRNNYLTQTEFVKEIIKIFKLLFDMGAKEIYYTVENNGTGKGVIALLVNSSNPVVHDCNFISDKEGKQMGFMMTRKSKPAGCMRLKDLLESEQMIIHSERLINELKFFVKKGESFAAESGMHDDLVMSTVLMCLLLNDMVDFEESLYDKFNEVNVDLDEEGFEVGVYF